MTTSNHTQRPDAAFKQQLLQTLPAIRPYSRRLTRDEQKAEDLLQETALRAMEKHHQWQRGTNLTAWLRTIMRSRYMESQRKKQPVCVGDVSVDGPSPVSREAGQPIRLELQETGEAIDRLEDSFREVLDMVVFEGSSYEAAAQLLGVPVGTVRSRLSRARTALRTELDSDRRYPIHAYHSS